MKWQIQKIIYIGTMLLIFWMRYFYTLNFFVVLCAFVILLLLFRFSVLFEQI